ncbi:MAG: hypothetical protein NC932_01425, partial [Candidatus Omnitrophica bacterium]|nr:hypothetical protein [Candidatus Omnitrophota bacterium]
AITKDEYYLQNPQKQAKLKITNIRLTPLDSFTSNGIDHLVYKLYNLTEEEIKIVEKFNIRG